MRVVVVVVVGVVVVVAVVLEVVVGEGAEEGVGEGAAAEVQSLGNSEEVQMNARLSKLNPDTPSGMPQNPELSRKQT